MPDEEIELSIEDFFKLAASGGQFEIETPDGWQPIGDLYKKNNKDCYKINLKSGLTLSCSSDHLVFTKRGWIPTAELNVGEDVVLTRLGDDELVAKEFIGKTNTFDLEVLHEQHRYFSDDVISHNTGKSLSAKACAREYGMPLLRLDFGSLFGSYIGDSEKNARSAIKMAEAIAPCILWCDEIEKGLSGMQSSGRSDSGTTARVLSTFLTWMQEKKAPVFVIATANNAAEIPPEFMRAGRFDEIFFTDLPNVIERREITKALLRRKKRDVDTFNVNQIAQEADGFTGAEIEKAIDLALFEGYEDDRREITTYDITDAFKRFQPISRMQPEVIDRLQTWAKERCVRANSPDIVPGGNINAKKQIELATV
jgi:intein/homing endonuclease